MDKPQLWAITGDWQVDSNPPYDKKVDGRSLRFDDSVARVEELLREAKRRGATHLFFLGDATEHKTANSQERTALSRLFKTADESFDTWAIPGNHDGSLYQLSSSTLEPMGILLPNLKYFDKFTYKHSGNQCFVFLPYLHGISEGEIAQMFTDFFASQVTEGKEYHLFGHYGLKGVASGAANQILDRDVLSFETVQANRFKRIWMGHIHKNQYIKNAAWPGSTITHDFGERLDRKGFILYDPQADLQQFVPLESKHKLIQVDYTQFTDELALDAMDLTEYSGAIVKLTGRVEAGDDAYYPHMQKAVEAVLKDAASVTWAVDRERVFRETRSEVTAAQTFREMVKLYITENAVKLKISDPDASIAKAWELLDENATLKTAYSEVHFESIRYIDFLTFKDETLKLDDGIHLISALNGSGKSNSLGGIYFAINGESMTGVNYASLIRQGADKGQVILNWRSGSDKYELARTLTMSKTGTATQKVSLKCNGADIKDGGNKDAQAKAEALVGMDELAFRNTTFFVQDDPKAIIEASAADRKAVILSVMKMSVLGEVFAALGKVIAIENRKLEDIKLKRETLAAIAFEASKEDLEKEAYAVTGKIADLTEVIHARTRAAQDVNGRITLMQTTVFNSQTLLSEKLDIMARPAAYQALWEANDKKLLKNLQDLRDKRDKSKVDSAAWAKERGEIEASLPGIKAEIARLAGERAKPAKTVEALNAEIDTLKDSVSSDKSTITHLAEKAIELRSFENQEICPTCKQGVKDLHLSNVEKLQEVEGKLGAARKRVAENEFALKALYARRQEANDLSVTLMEQLGQAESSLPRAESRITSLGEMLAREEGIFVEIVASGKAAKASYDEEKESAEKAIVTAAAEAGKAKIEYDALVKTIADLKSVKEGLEASKASDEAQAAKHTNDQGGLRIRLAVIAEQIKQIDSVAREKGQVEVAWEKASKDLQVVEPLRRVFSPDGLQAAVLESMRPELEHRINFYLNKLRVTKFRVLIELQAETKSTGNIKEVFDFLVDNGAAPMLDVRSYSGGERKMIAIAIHLALADIAFERSGVRFPFFVLDEVYDGLDHEKRQALTSVIFGLPADMILVVCHIADVADAYDDIIEGTWSLETGTKFRPKAIPGRAK